MFRVFSRGRSAPSLNHSVSQSCDNSTIQQRRIWLVGIGVGLALLHSILTWQLLHQTDQIINNLLFWAAIIGVLINQRHAVGNNCCCRYIGLFLLGAIVVKSCSEHPVEAWFVRLFPALAVTSLELLIAQFQLKRYWRTGLLLMPLMIPKGMVEGIAEQLVGQPFRFFTAQFATFVLHYIGFDAVQKDTVISLNQGAVDVLFRCTGIPLFILLLQLALLFFVTFSLPPKPQIKLLAIAALIAFLLSSLRVALMALLVEDPVAFDYWHGGSGSQLFSTGAIVLFGWCCQQFLPRIQVN